MDHSRLVKTAKERKENDTESVMGEEEAKDQLGSY